MTENRASLTQLQGTASPTYSDTAAVDDIQALLTSPCGPRGLDAVDCIADIVARTGRSLVSARIITSSTGTDERGLPFAFVDADGTYVRVSQNPDNPGIWVHVWTTDDTEASGLVLNVNGRHLCHRGEPATTQGLDPPALAEAEALGEEEADHGLQ